MDAPANTTFYRRYKESFRAFSLLSILGIPTLTLTLNLIQPSSMWMHWAIQTPIPVCWGLLASVSCHPGPLLKSEASQHGARGGKRWWSIRIRWPSQRSFSSPSLLSMLIVASFSSLTYLIFASRVSGIILWPKNQIKLNKHNKTQKNNGSPCKEVIDTH